MISIIEWFLSLACLKYELDLKGLKVERQQSLPMVYKGVSLDCGYRLDLVVEEEVVVAEKRWIFLSGGLFLERLFRVGITHYLYNPVKVSIRSNQSFSQRKRARVGELFGAKELDGAGVLVVVVEEPGVPEFGKGVEGGAV